MVDRASPSRRLASGRSGSWPMPGRLCPSTTPDLRPDSAFPQETLNLLACERGLERDRQVAGGGRRATAGRADRRAAAPRWVFGGRREQRHRGARACPLRIARPDAARLRNAGHGGARGARYAALRDGPDPVSGDHPHGRAPLVWRSGRRHRTRRDGLHRERDRPAGDAGPGWRCAARESVVARRCDARPAAPRCRASCASRDGSRQFVGSATSSPSRPELTAALHRLRSTLARVRAEIELAHSDGDPPPVDRLLVDLHEALDLLGQVEAAAFSIVSVLVVDDDERLAELTARGLRRLGYEAESSGRLRALRPREVVVFDLGLFASLDASERGTLKAAHPIVVTGATDPGSRA